MKLWLISQTENNGYDTYDSAVVAAETEVEAKGIIPCDCFWASSPDKVIAKEIGTANDGVTGVICASYNA